MPRPEAVPLPPSGTETRTKNTQLKIILINGIHGPCTQNTGMINNSCKFMKSKFL